MTSDELKSMQEIKKWITDSIDTKKLILENQELLKKIDDIASKCLNVLQKRGKIIFAGNGGSFADAQHLSAEFTSRFLFDRAPLASIALGTNNSAISAIGNDYGYEHVFARELESIGSENDIFIPITTSGNSQNIIAAIESAIKNNIPTYALTGGAGGQVKEKCNCLIMPSTDTARIQESHILVGHIICGLVEKRYFAS